jgi:hypothetical protein
MRGLIFACFGSSYRRSGVSDLVVALDAAPQEGRWNWFIERQYDHDQQVVEAGLLADEILSDCTDAKQLQALINEVASCLSTEHSSVPSWLVSVGNKNSQLLLDFIDGEGKPVLKLPEPFALFVYSFWLQRGKQTFRAVRKQLPNDLHQANLEACSRLLSALQLTADKPDKDEKGSILRSLVTHPEGKVRDLILSNWDWPLRISQAEMMRLLSTMLLHDSSPPSIDLARDTIRDLSRRNKTSLIQPIRDALLPKFLEAHEHSQDYDFLDLLLWSMGTDREGLLQAIEQHLAAGRERNVLHRLAHVGTRTSLSSFGVFFSSVEALTELVGTLTRWKKSGLSTADATESFLSGVVGSCGDASVQLAEKLVDKKEVDNLPTVHTLLGRVGFERVAELWLSILEMAENTEQHESTWDAFVWAASRLPSFMSGKEGEVPSVVTGRLRFLNNLKESQKLSFQATMLLEQAIECVEKRKSDWLRKGEGLLS